MERGFLMPGILKHRFARYFLLPFLCMAEKGKEDIQKRIANLYNLATELVSFCSVENIGVL